MPDAKFKIKMLSKSAPSSIIVVTVTLQVATLFINTSATRGHPGRIGMLLSAHFGKLLSNLHGMLSWTHAHV